jgi:hypothetical protein
MKTLNEYIKSISSAFPICRANMPQITNIPKFQKFLKKNKVFYKKVYGMVDDLIPTQQEFDTVKVETIIAAKAFNKPIIVSEDGYVIDGHHRFFAALETNTPLHMIEIDSNVTESLRLCYEYTESFM